MKIDPSLLNLFRKIWPAGQPATATRETGKIEQTEPILNEMNSHLPIHYLQPKCCIKVTGYSIIQYIQPYF